MPIPSSRTDSSSVTLRARESVSAEHRCATSGTLPTSLKNGFSDSFGSRALRLRMRKSPAKNNVAAISEEAVFGR